MTRYRPAFRLLSLTLAVLFTSQASGYANQSRPQGCPADYLFHTASRCNLGGLPCDAFDRANRLLSLINERIEPHTILSSFVYTHDNVGNRLTMTDNEGRHTFDYDDVYRLEEVLHPLGIVGYTYDNVGNRLTMTVDSTVTTYRYDDANRLEEAGNRTFVHDPNGNLTSETEGGNITVYTYDPENRLLSHGPSSNPTQNTYLYDGVGRRVQKNQDGLISNFYYTDFDVLFETDSTDTLTVSYTHGAHTDEILSSSRNDFYLYDGLGSVQSVRDDQADPIASYTYDAFGAIRSQQGSSPNRYNFTGRELDRESGLYYYRNRYYHPQIGRFITKDPIGLAGGVNYYAYVKNAPLNYTDPLGLNPVLVYQLSTVLRSLASSPHVSRALGRAGELAVGIAKNTERIRSVTGASYRVPDFFTRGQSIGEAKNVCYLSYSNQLRDFIAYSKEFGVRFHLYVRQNTQISEPLQQALDDVGAAVERVL